MPSDSTNLCWVDGKLLPGKRAVVRADDSAFCEGRGCLTTVRIAAGRPRFVDRHVKRLQDGAKALRLGEVAEVTIRRALAELGEATLPDGEGVIRLQVSRDGDGATHLIGIARKLGNDPSEWSAIIVALPHDGASLVDGMKVTSRLTLSLAAEDARAAGVDEAVLLDATGHLIEGARTNLFVAASDGSLWTPPIASGAVAGIARTLALERIPEIEERDIAKSELLATEELIAVNAVRGARPITRLNDRKVGEGRPGPWSTRLAEILATGE
ncbi:MAG: aminotransferase class IV family protein [Myxococcales bacterium]|nr:aminotransferase class IV family protein [Myxococcales bacterium]